MQICCIFYQKYHNTIEYLFGVWDPDVAIVGFKFLNTGDSRVRGVDMSLAATTPETNKRFGVSALIGYTYIEPVSLTPDSVYARDKSLGGFGQDLSYKSSSMDTTNNILKFPDNILVITLSTFLQCVAFPFKSFFFV